MQIMTVLAASQYWQLHSAAASHYGSFTVLAALPYWQFHSSGSFTVLAVSQCWQPHILVVSQCWQPHSNGSLIVLEASKNWQPHILEASHSGSFTVLAASQYRRFHSNAASQFRAFNTHNPGPHNVWIRHCLSTVSVTVQLLTLLKPIHATIHQKAKERTHGHYCDLEFVYSRIKLKPMVMIKSKWT